MLPIHHRPPVHEMRNGSWNLLGGIARIGPGRRGQRRLNNQITESEILLRASTDSEERIRSVGIGRIPVEIKGPKLQSLKNRPTKILPGAGDYAQFLPGIVADIAHVKDSRISIRCQMASSVRTQVYAERISKTVAPGPGL